MTQKKTKYLSILLVLTILMVISISVFDLCRIIIKIDKTLSAIDDGNIFYLIQHESGPTDTSIESYDNLFQSLTNMDAYTYYERYQQPLDIPRGSGKFFDDSMDSYMLTDEYERVRCIQISENVQYDFNLSISMGRLLRAEDFILNENNSIPVLMGNGYAETYKLGDRFSGDYLFGNYDFYVIGFLEKGSSITMSIGENILDNCIVMPSFEVPANTQESDSLKFHYANKTSGIIKTSAEKAQEVSELFLPLIENTDAGTYSWVSTASSFGFQRIAGLKLNAWYIIAPVLFLLFALIEIVYVKRHQENLYEMKAFSIRSLLTFIVFTSLAILFSSIVMYYIHILLGFRYLIGKYLAIPLFFSAVLYLFIAVIPAWKSKLKTD